MLAERCELDISGAEWILHFVRFVLALVHSGHKASTNVLFRDLKKACPECPISLSQMSEFDGTANVFLGDETSIYIADLEYALVSAPVGPMP